MATVTITIPDTLVPRLTNAAHALYPQYGPNGSNLAPAALFKQITADHWKSILVQYEVPIAADNQTTQSEADASGIG